MSADNHARRLGIQAATNMSVGTLATEITRTRDHRAKVIVEEDNLSEALDMAMQESKKHFLTFIHPYDDSLLIAGHDGDGNS